MLVKYLLSFREKKLMRILKGRVVLTKQDYENLKIEEENGKVIYVLYTHIKEKSFINQELFEKYILNISTKKKDIHEYFNINYPHLREFLIKIYGTDVISNIYMKLRNLPESVQKEF